MTSHSSSHPGLPVPDTSESGAVREPAERDIEVDGGHVDSLGLSQRLRRRLRRQAALYGSTSARDFLASLLELEGDGEDFYARAGDALDVSPEHLRALIEEA
jgi:hypothetical protein